jgi:hypothetical protein
MNTMNVEIHIFLTSALGGGEWSASRPDLFTPRKRVPDTHWIGDWVDLKRRSRRRGEKKILDPTGTRTPTLRGPARS